jgi:acyl-CoA synthetase (AMP-forming)/AMP-acid ligase II
VVFVALLALGAVLVNVSTAHAATKLKAVIDKSEHQMYVYAGDGKLLYNWPASTGGGYTPTGTWHVTGFAAGMHKSSKYKTKMYWTVYYEPADGTARRAVHGISDAANVAALGKSNAGMGCPHLSVDNSKIFYDLAAQYKHSEVVIVIQP